MTKFTKTLKVLNQSVSYLLMLFSLFLSSSLLGQTENDWAEHNLKGKVRTLNEVSYKIKEEFGNFYKEKEHNLNQYIIFNRKGLKIESILESELIRLHYLYKYSYNEYGNLSESVSYTSDGDFLRKFKFIFVKGNLYEKYLYENEDDNIPIWTYSYEHDNDDNRIQKDSWLYVNGIGKIEKTYLYKYDYRGNNTEIKEYNSHGKLRVLTIYKYDNKSNVIEEYITSTDSQVHKEYTYDFDNNGNWIRCLVSVDGNPEYFIEREIEYF